MEKITWKEFRESGCLWFVNTILHLFGLAIVCVTDDDGYVVEAYPARVPYRGFSEATNDAGYMKLTKYLSDNIEKIKEGADL